MKKCSIIHGNERSAPAKIQNGKHIFSRKLGTDVDTNYWFTKRKSVYFLKMTHAGGFQQWQTPSDPNMAANELTQRIVHFQLRSCQRRSFVHIYFLRGQLRWDFGRGSPIEVTNECFVGTFAQKPALASRNLKTESRKKFGKGAASAHGIV